MPVGTEENYRTLTAPTSRPDHARQDQSFMGPVSSLSNGKLVNKLMRSFALTAPLTPT